MTQTVNEALYLAAIARVCKGSNVIGVAFFVAEGYLLTCAHVVSKALGHNRRSDQILADEIRGQSVPLEFRLEEQEHCHDATVVYWRSPPHDSTSNRDVAILKLKKPMPSAARVLPLFNGPELWEQNFRVLGFPSKLDPGGWATGRIQGSVYGPSGLVQIKDDQTTGYAIEPGFSGAPVWSPSLEDTIVGMTVARDKEREGAKVGFMLPVRRLKPALEAIELETLMDILEPQATTLENAFEIAYRATLPDRLHVYSFTRQETPAQTLRHNLTTLLSLPSQTETVPSLLMLIAAILTRSDLKLPQPLQAALVQWLRHQFDDPTDLLTIAQQRLTQILDKTAQAQPHLLLWVRPSPDYQTQDRYLVRALFIPDGDHYDSASGAGGHFLKAVDKFRDPNQGDTVAGAKLEAILQKCLQEVALDYRQYLIDKTLILELIFPLTLLLLNSEVDHRWKEQALQEFDPGLQDSLEDLIQPLGKRYQVVLRLTERLDQKFSNYRPFWETKWKNLETAKDDQKPTSQVLSCGHKVFMNTFCDSTCLGMYLDSPIESEELKKRLLSTILGGNPVALWLRQAPPKSRFKPSFRTLLNYPIGEITHKVRETRQDAFKAKSKPHVGHHLALVWDNPHLVPPEESAYTMPLDMP
ncbi:MAG: trypsin-like peptidase domain-containing protein [Nodosilinea sp.]